MRKLLVVFILFLFHKATFAQFNDSTYYHAGLTSAGSINKTNTGRSYLLNNSVNFGIKKKDIVLTSTNTWIYGTQNSVTTNNDFSSSFTVDLYTKFPRFYYWGLLNYNTSFSLKINNQILGGFGAIYSVVKKKNNFLNISEGILYDKSNLLGGNLDYYTYRNSFRLNYHFTFNNNMIAFDGSDYVQNSLLNIRDYIIKSVTSVSIKLHKSISFTTSLNYNKMKITNSETLLFTYGLKYDKYF